MIFLGLLLLGSIALQVVTFIEIERILDNTFDIGQDLKYQRGKK